MRAPFSSSPFAAALAVLGLALGLALVPGTARLARADEPAAMDARARAHLDAGLAAYQAKRYAAAIAEFEAGYAVDPRPELLFAWAQALRLSGDCDAAIERYEMFIASGPAPEQAEAAQGLAEKCREAVAATSASPRAAVTPRTPAAATSPAAAAGAADAAPRARRWWRDPLAAGLATGGLVALGIGLGYGVTVGAAEDEATRATTYADFAEAKAEANHRRSLSAWSLGTGALLLAGAGVRWGWLRHTEGRGGPGAGRPGVGVSLAPSAAGAGAVVSFGGGF